MYTTKELDLDLIHRLNSVKPSVKSKLFGLSLEELITLPLRKNKKIELFDQKGNPNSKNIQLINDIIYAKVQDRVSFRDAAYSKIVGEELKINTKKKTIQYKEINNEYQFLELIVDNKNFPKELKAILKEPIINKNKKTPVKRKRKNNSFNDVYATFEEIQNYFNPVGKTIRSTNLTGLKNVLINNEMDVFPSRKWLYGLKRIKHPNSLKKNISVEILKLKKEYGKNWNLKENLLKLNLNDVVGMWFVSKERIDVKNKPKYYNTSLHKLKDYIFDQSTLNVEDYENKYKDNTLEVDSMRMHVSPSKYFIDNTPIGASLYQTYIPELGGPEDIKISIHLQGVYAAIKNKFYGRGAHAVYKYKKTRKEDELFSELSANEKMKHLENEYRIEYLMKSISLIK